MTLASSPCSAEDFDCETAPAKINLALHVTGRREDGYHLLDSLVVFTKLGDTVTVGPGSGLTVTGPFAAAVPTGEDNLCLRALALVGETAAITLDKHLPPASGIGGGTADAAAVLRALGRRPEQPQRLGADLPACLESRPLRMRGTGELIQPLRLPDLHLVLVNPGVPVATPQVFGALDSRDGVPMLDVPEAADAAALTAWLAGQRNDLEPPARRLCPVIGECIGALDQAGAALARMSGSGATCFGLFGTAAAAGAAAATIAAGRHDWWVRATCTIAGLSPDGSQG